MFGWHFLGGIVCNLWAVEEHIAGKEDGKEANETADGDGQKYQAGLL